MNGSHGLRLAMALLIALYGTAFAGEKKEAALSSDSPQLDASPAMTDESLEKSEIEKAEKILSDKLKDPSSVQFKDVIYNPTKHAVCGTYNAKNSYGAYIGFSDFAVDENRHVFTIRPASPGDTYAELQEKLADMKGTKILCPNLVER